MNILNIVTIGHDIYGTRKNSNAHEIAIILIGIEIAILGSTLTPFVSSSKNLNNPALDAGSGELFLSAISYFSD